MSLGELYIFPPLIWSRNTHWSNYLQAMTVVDFPIFFKNTMTILIPVLAGTLLVGSMCAYAFARLKFPLRGFWFALVLSNLMLPYAVVMLPRFILWSRLGAVNTFYPLIIPAWFGTGIGGAFMIFLLRQFFLTIPKDFEDAAIIDGAGYFMIYWRIMLPLVKPALIVVSLFTFMFVWNDDFLCYFSMFFNLFGSKEGNRIL